MIVGLLFAIFGVSCTLASACSDVEAMKQCMPLGESAWYKDQWPHNAHELDLSCRNVQKELGCEIEFGKRCPNSIFGQSLQGLKQLEGVYADLCGNSHHFRKQFLDHVPCLNSVIQDLSSTCRTNNEINDCNTSVQFYRNCVSEGVHKLCGVETQHVFDLLIEPLLPIYATQCKSV
ncbi:uncharacterized protein LOC129233118 [Uloborus diversus]|uniref:uncharacterized protein LOC129225109 n=1 Tax=Uloborus diversus TaxID=327109 RepID=UPI00240933FC|nr:uncharacterized protein LOC129225109 [Uloborus diversus]XP_054723153.1 uncharacterized protein LOC129233118 [Uloborus diversus]